MPEIYLVSPGAVRSLTCPRCGRPTPAEQAGVAAAQATWGFCAALARRDGRVIGMLSIAAVLEDVREPVALIGSGWVDPGRIGVGVGRRLVQSVAAGLVRERVDTLLARVAPVASCATLPPGFLGSVGFAPTPIAGLWRLSLDQTVIAPRRTVWSALERLASAVRPVPPPEPARRGAAR